jgi:hypothetical protein
MATKIQVYSTCKKIIRPVKKDLPFGNAPITSIMCNTRYATTATDTYVARYIQKNRNKLYSLSQLPVGIRTEVEFRYKTNRNEDLNVLLDTLCSVYNDNCFYDVEEQLLLGHPFQLLFDVYKSADINDYAIRIYDHLTFHLTRVTNVVQQSIDELEILSILERLLSYMFSGNALVLHESLSLYL